jgi:hypothetical protein
MLTLLAALLLCAFAADPQLRAVTAQQPQPQPERRIIRGVVFDDANGNGLRDAGERGIAGAVVSDQSAVAQTAADGSYELQFTAAATLAFVSLPDGWSAPRGFWMPLRFEAGMARADFALRERSRVQQGAPRSPQQADSDFIFLHASDTHLSPQSLPRIARLREIVQREKPAFLLITGDLVRDALRVPEAEARGYYDLLAAELAKFPVPVFTVPGNHEIFGIERHLSLVSPQHPLYGKKMYHHYRGPNFYSFNWGGIHFVGLDTADVDNLSYYGHIDAAQLDWLKRDLAAAPLGAPVVTFNHIPLATAVDAMYGYVEESPAPSLIRVGGKSQYRHVVSNTAELLAALGSRRLEIALGGHMHVAESLLYQTALGPTRFHQTGAVVGPSAVGGMQMASGVTLYRVRNARVDNGAFLPLDPPAAK